MFKKTIGSHRVRTYTLNLWALTIFSAALTLNTQPFPPINVSHLKDKRWQENSEPKKDPRDLLRLTWQTKDATVALQDAQAIS